jgi:hypothetical protein
MHTRACAHVYSQDYKITRSQDQDLYSQDNKITRKSRQEVSGLCTVRKAISVLKLGYPHCLREENID